MEKIIYTVSESVEGLSPIETRINIEYEDIGGYDGVAASPVEIRIGAESFTVEPQQLMELGALFIALSGVTGIDFESAESLLEGFALKGKEASKKLACAIEE